MLHNYSINDHYHRHFGILRQGLLMFGSCPHLTDLTRSVCKGSVQVGSTKVTNAVLSVSWGSSHYSHRETMHWKETETGWVLTSRFCMWVCIGLVADVGLVVCQQQRSLGADPGMMSLPARPRSRSYLWHCVFDGERTKHPVCVCVCALTLFLCGDVVIVICLCQVCVSQTASRSCPQKMSPGDSFSVPELRASVYVSFSFTEWNVRLFSFFYFRFMTIGGQTDVRQDDISLEFTADVRLMVGKGNDSPTVWLNWSFYRMKTPDFTVTVFPFLIHCQSAISPRCMEPVWCFPCYICLCVAREGWAPGSQRAESLKQEPVFMFVSGFPSLSFFPCTHNSMQLQTLHHTPLHFSLFSPSISPSTSLKYSLSQLQLNLSCLHFPSTLLSLYTPASRHPPACVCAPVWLLAWSVWMLRRRKTCQVERSWEELRGWEERVPVVWAARFSVGTQEPRRLCKLYQEGVCSKCA